MLRIEYSSQFKRDYKLSLKRACNPELLTDVIDMLAKEQPLPEKYRDHSLITSRNYKGIRECGNAIYNRIGYWFIKSNMKNWSWCLSEQGAIVTSFENLIHISAPLWAHFL